MSKFQFTVPRIFKKKTIRYEQTLHIIIKMNLLHMGYN